MLKLITIPISHYCEKARWALERAGLDFEEDAHLQVLHIIPVKRAGGDDSVPALITEDKLLTDSTDILKWVHTKKGGLYPEAACKEIDDLEEHYDEVFGPAGRLWMYYHMLPYVKIAKKYGTYGVPRWQSRLFPLIYLFLRLFIPQYLKVSPATASSAEVDIQKTFDDVAARLQDGRKYLAGNSFTAADLTFAALSAPVVLPEQYGVPLPRVDELPAYAAEQIRKWREHPAGQFALRLYREER